MFLAVVDHFDSDGSQPEIGSEGFVLMDQRRRAGMFQLGGLFEHQEQKAIRPRGSIFHRETVHGAQLCVSPGAPGDWRAESPGRGASGSSQEAGLSRSKILHSSPPNAECLRMCRA